MIRVVATALRAAAIFIAVYAVIASTAINVGVIERLANVNPSEMTLRHGFVWTVWPGWVHVRDLDLRYQDKNVQFHLVIAEVSTRISLTDLLRQRASFRAVRAEGVRWRMLHKVDDLERNSERIAAFPTIFPGPPIRGPDTPPSDPDDLWTIHIRDVVGSVHELWFLEYRWVGRGRVEGGFELRPTEELWVGPARLDLEPAPIKFGETTLIDDFAARIETTVHPFNPDIPEGADIFDFFSSAIRIDGKLLAADPFRTYASGNELEILDPGTIEADVAFDHGVLAPGGALTVKLPDARWMKARLAVRGSASFGFAIEDAGTSVRADLASVQMLARGKTAARAPKGGLRLGGRSLRLASLGPFHLEEIDLPSLTIPDLSRLRVLSPALAVLEGGSAEIGAVVKASRGIAKGGGAILLRGARAKLDNKTIAATGTISADLEISTEDGGGELRDLEVDLGQLAVRGGESSGRGRWRLESPRVVFDRIPPSEIEGRVMIEGQNGAMLLALFPSLGKVGDAVVSALPLGNVTIEAEIQKKAPRTTVHLITGRCGGVQAQGRWADAGQGGRAAFLFAVGAVSAGVALEADGIAVTPMATSDWLSERYKALGLTAPALDRGEGG